MVEDDITLAPKKLIRTRRASEGSASEPSLARRISMCKDAKLSCRGNKKESQPGRQPPWVRDERALLDKYLFRGTRKIVDWLVVISNDLPSRLGKAGNSSQAGEQ